MDSATQSFAGTSPAPADFTSSATYIANLRMTAWNATSSLPSAKELVNLPLRIASQIDHAVFRTFPRYLLQATGLIPIAADTGNVAGATTGLAGAGEAAGQVAADVSTHWTTVVSEAFHASTLKSYFGMLQYLTSRWAFTCFALSLILNRINVYGASRQRIHLSWSKRLGLRLIPILLFVPQIYQLMSAIRCQTSPDYSLYRHGDNDKFSPLDWSYDGGAFHSLTSTLLFAQTDAQACAAVGMSRPDPETRAPYGSFALLWPSFLRLSVSHLVESLSASLQQFPMMTEVGMSVFEHSLAFAEAETMITTTISTLAKEVRARRGATASASSANAESTSKDTVMASGTIMALSDAVNSLVSPHVLDRVNVPVEVLLVALLSSCNALSSNIISVLGKQRKWRLVNTGFWGTCFMGSFIWGFVSTSRMERIDDHDPRPVSSLLHFPTVAIVGFLPHMVILLGIAVCLCIYSVALLLTAISLGTNPNIRQPTSLKDRFVIAHENLQAAMQLRGIQIRWYEDFYTGLLRVGFAALTAASEAVFLNEGRAVEMRQFTWLEEERLDELQSARDQRAKSYDSQFQIIEEYGVPPSSPGGSDKGGRWESGYSKERKFDKKENELEGKDSFAYPIPRSGGIGAVQRTSKFYLLFIYIRGIIFLVGGWITYGLGALLDRIGITARPRWLRRIVGRSLKRMHHEQENMNRHRGVMDLKSYIASTDDIDIEPNMRKKIKLEHGSDNVEAVLDERMYDWWKEGGWFGTRDESGSYAPSQVEDDLTSVVSASEASSASSIAGEDEWEDEDEGSGQRTPTQTTPRPSWSFSYVETKVREPTPEEEDRIDTPLDPATLARLLNPPDKASREEARILASHLSPQSASRIMTRSRYRHELESERSRVLLAGRLPPTSAPTVSLFNVPPSSNTSPHPLSHDEEAEVLEKLLITRRQRRSRGDNTSKMSPSNQRSPPEQNPTSPSTSPPNPDPSDNSTGELGLQCVVCQSSARTIIAWPCRCLITCEDCRVSLALNNFGNCVTCRRQVGGFVRLFVP